MDIPLIVYPFTVDEHFSCFQVIASITLAAVSIVQNSGQNTFISVKI